MESLATAIIQGWEEHTEKKTELNERREKRIACWEKNKAWLDEAKMRKGKGTILRKRFWVFLWFAQHKVFETEEDEYQYIKKFGRGGWDDMRGFTREEQEKIVEIGREYGSFDY